MQVFKKKNLMMKLTIIGNGYTTKFLAKDAIKDMVMKFQ